ncbi:MAG TPA: formylglycine-generating enzyme family protein [Smithellaceae bacterium]|nr:formylglycine-generating enzyme family protein [Smithellaceae bacterium]HQM44599.1 formylglycine-generating enzyme family protein [Smithellaceae bacterium]
MKRQLILLWVVFLSFSMCVDAAELKNEVARQEGNRLVITYDLAGKEKEADVTLTLTVDGKTYKASALHVEGDVGKVKPGRGKKISWNILKDFPRGLRGDVDWELTTAGNEFTEATTGIQMVFVQGGCFQMGRYPVLGGSSDEKPVHEVCVGDFYIGKYEVTQGQWKAVMGNNPSYFKDCGDNCPVEKVSWNAVQDFIRKLKSQSGKDYRLPTEAEWEYAATSGGKSEKWAGTSNESSFGDYAWYNGNSGSKTHPIGQKMPNGLGLYDMSGNVWEWCSDWYKSDYYKSSPRDNPQGPSSGTSRVNRGGGWSFIADYARASYRCRSLSILRGSDLGFRLAVSAQ